MLKYFGLLFMFVLLCCVGCVYFAYLALLRMVRVALCVGKHMHFPMQSPSVGKSEQLL
jgi:hypothetical protein